VTLDLPYATRFPSATPQTAKSIGAPAASSASVTTTETTDDSGAGWSGTVEVWFFPSSVSCVRDHASSKLDTTRTDVDASTERVELHIGVNRTSDAKGKSFDTARIMASLTSS
jgi:hypothetical protein